MTDTNYDGYKPWPWRSQATAMKTWKTNEKCTVKLI